MSKFCYNQLKKFKRENMKYFAVIGNPIAHSISPRLHNNAFCQLGVSSVYSRILFDKDINESQFRQKIFSYGLSGANVTVPFKEIALRASDEIDAFAQKIGSVNTLLIKNQKIHAYNTDAPGFLKAISEFEGIKKALILGAGGTARAISAALAGQGVKVSILNRSLKSGFENYDFFTPENFLENSSFDIIVNTTPAGLTFAGLPFSKELLEAAMKDAKYAFDAVYGKKTDFIALAESLGLKCKDGLSMLLYQAVFAFDIFTAQKHDIKAIKKAMKEAFIN